MPENRVFEYERMLPEREVAEHEVFLSFNSDGDALSFLDWMFKTGEALFLAFRESYLEEERGGN